MTIKTGKGPISFMAVLAIWSISLTVNLPGLAITPMLDTLQQIFPHTTQLEIQLLTSLPNLLIIPFVLLSGKLSMSNHKIGVVVWALVIYLGCGIAYMFARSMTALIVISALLGCGCGLLIPLAAGLLADTFTGKYRMKQLGIKSGISNLALVVATLLVGVLAKSHDWRIPFLVYLIPAIPLALSPFLRRIPDSDLYYQAPTQPQRQEIRQNSPAGTMLRDGFYVKRIWALIGVYFFVCLSILAISYYLPFLAASRHVDSAVTGTATSLMYLAIFLPGFLLPQVTRLLKGHTFLICTILMGLGLLLIGLFPCELSFCAGALLTGAGYGVFQPLIYDKATQTVISPRKSTLALSFVLAANYLSISVAPFLTDGLANLLHCHSERFPFMLNVVLSAAFAALVIIYRKSFIFRVDKEYYS